MTNPKAQELVERISVRCGLEAVLDAVAAPGGRAILLRARGYEDPYEPQQWARYTVVERGSGAQDPWAAILPQLVARFEARLSRDKMLLAEAQSRLEAETRSEAAPLTEGTGQEILAVLRALAAEKKL